MTLTKDQLIKTVLTRLGPKTSQKKANDLVDQLIDQIKGEGLTVSDQPQDDKKTGTDPMQPIVYVRRSQKAIATNYRGRGLCDYLGRTYFKTVVRDIAVSYFPETYRKKIETTIEQIETAYLYAMVLAPYLQHLKGTYRPSWHRGTLLSWFRRSVSSATRQWYFLNITVGESPSASKAIENAQAFLSIEDVDFLTLALPYLDNLSRSDGLKSVLAQGFYYPLAFAHIDEEYRQLTQFDALTKNRQKLRVMKKGTASYIRKGRTIYLLADRYCKDRIEGDWKDLRVESVDVLDYRLSHRKEGEKEGVHIEIQPEKIADLKAAVKTILQGGANPGHKVFRINNVIADFAKTHRYATGSSAQLFKLDDDLFKLLRGKIGTHYPQFKDQLRSVKGLYMPLVKPILNPFLTTTPVSNDTWRSIWSPYR